ncbi:MAG: YdcF family protein [Anaerolineae bacterium]|nr:YdcF family protein [Anaerolineae bacterium]
MSIGALLLLMLFSHLVLPKLFSYLDVSQQPQVADAIVVLGGGRARRAGYAAWLYQHGYSNKVVVSGNDDVVGYYTATLREAGVPEEVLVMNDQATSTYDEAEQILSLLLDMDANSALIVTDRFHTRRASATYHHVFQAYQIDLTIVSPEDSVDTASWWTSEFGQSIASEYLKMPYYWLVYGIWSG